MDDPVVLSVLGATLGDVLGIHYWALAPGAAGAFVGLAFSAPASRFRMGVSFVASMLAAGYLSQAAFRLLPVYLPAFAVMSDRNLMSLCAFGVGFLAKIAIPFLIQFVQRKMEKIDDSINS